MPILTLMVIINIKYQDKLMKKNKKAVSFAEVIIAVAVLSTVAAFTIPTLIQNFQMSYFKSQWKTIYKD